MLDVICEVVGDLMEDMEELVGSCEVVGDRREDMEELVVNCEENVEGLVACVLFET